MAPLDPAVLARHHRRNRLQTAAVLGGLGLWMAMVGWLVAGINGVIWAVGGTALLLTIQPSRSAALLRALYGALPVTQAEAPGLYGLTASLAERAGLERPPTLLYIPRPEPAALSAGGRAEPVIAVTEGLLGLLPGRELGAVLAHEISHLRHGDLRILRLAEAAGRLTRLLAMLGVLSLALYLPGAAAMGAKVPVAALLLMLAAPVASDLLTLKLSRTREFEADAGAAEITGDPRGLMAALAIMERIQPQGWERMGRTRSWLTLVRTHPSTSERIARLRELMPPPDHHRVAVPDALRPVLDPNRRRPGPWGRPGLRIR